MGALTAIQQRIGRRLAKALAPYMEPEPRPDVLGAGETGLLDADLLAMHTKPWQVSRNRHQRHKIRDRMAEESGLIGKALNVLADTATAPEEEGDATNAFDLKCDNDDVRDEADRIVQTLKLKDRSWGIARRLATYGNEMREPVLDPSATRVVRYKLLPEQQVFRREDEFGRPEDPPWEQRAYYEPDGSGRPFAEWQIVHYCYPGDEDEIYGRGVLNCEREYMQLVAVQDAMVSGRLVRGMDRLVHKVPVAPKAGAAEQELSLKKYMGRWMRKRVLSANEGTGARDNPTAGTQDIFVPDPGKEYPSIGVDMLSPRNVQLTNIRDVEYLRAIVLAVLSVPMRYLNLGGTEAARASLGEGGISHEDIQFARTVRGIQSSLASGHSKVIALHLILRALNPIEHPVTLEFPVISTSDARAQAEIDYTRAQTLQIIGNFLEVPPGMIADYYMGLSPDERDRWFGKLSESMQAAVAEPKARAKHLEEIAGAVLVMANKELAGVNGDPTVGDPYGDKRATAAH